VELRGGSTMSTNVRYEYKLVRVKGGRRYQEKTLDRMGAQGWEYVETKGSAYPKFVFRRPLRTRVA
jgi:hypothetical protein